MIEEEGLYPDLQNQNLSQEVMGLILTQSLGIDTDTMRATRMMQWVEMFLLGWVPCNRQGLCLPMGLVDQWTLAWFPKIDYPVLMTEEEQAVPLMIVFMVEEVEVRLVVWEAADVVETLEEVEEAEEGVYGIKVDECQNLGSNVGQTFNRYRAHQSLHLCSSNLVF